MHMNMPVNADSPLFGAENVIYAYTRAQALADGVLIDVSDPAREAGFRLPVALTAGVWASCVAWEPEDSERQIHQDQSGRLWDVLWMASWAIRLQRGRGETDRLPYRLYVVPRDGQSQDAREVELHVHIGSGDAGEPVLTILLPGED
jgi:hypothetical protein